MHGYRVWIFPRPSQEYLKLALSRNPEGNAVSRRSDNVDKVNEVAEEQS